MKHLTLIVAALLTLLTTVIANAQSVEMVPLIIDHSTGDGWEDYMTRHENEELPFPIVLTNEALIWDNATYVGFLLSVEESDTVHMIGTVTFSDGTSQVFEEQTGLPVEFNGKFYVGYAKSFVPEIVPEITRLNYEVTVGDIKASIYIDREGSTRYSEPEQSEEPEQPEPPEEPKQPAKFNLLLHMSGVIPSMNRK